ncbi:hypothetical protein [Actinoplanes sp. CA-252034]|uniref:hypothetical protein n=1 Tax=Actinoplanes sp. CA-252034 TaxID=3239906 RepID=UPI003D9846E5
MREIILAVAATAAVTVPAGPAWAGPPTLGDLRNALLTEAEAPTGFHSLGDPSNAQLPIPRNRSVCEDDQPSGDESETTAVVAYFAEEDGTGFAVGVAAPDASNALAFVRAVENTITRCPTEGEGDDATTNTRLVLPSLGNAAAGFWTTGTGDGQSRGAAVAVADGDLLAVFEMSDGDESDQAEFLEFVNASVNKLAEVG